MEEEAADAFLKGVFTQACESHNLTVEPAVRGGMIRVSTPDGIFIEAFAADLGSVITVSVALEGTEVIRTMTLSPNEASSVEFVRTHFLEWVLNGGQYGTTSSPHLQGMSPEVVRRLDSYLDARSSARLRQANRTFRGIIERRPGAPLVGQRTSGMSRFTWRRLDIV